MDGNILQINSLILLTISSKTSMYAESTIPAIHKINERFRRMINAYPRYCTNRFESAELSITPRVSDNAQTFELQ